MLSKVKDFVVKNWQWLITTIVAIVFYVIGRSKDTKDEEVKLAELSKELEQKKTQEIIDGWTVAEEEKSSSMSENILQFEEKKAKILEEAGDIDIEEYLKAKGIIKDED